MPDTQKLAVLADIHGNALALEAVLADVKERGLNRMVNLGDTFYGPLDPGSTWSILRDLDIPTVLGNQDRILLEGGPHWENVPAFQAAHKALSPDGLNWLASLDATMIVEGKILLCHGTPSDDTAYLLEDVTTGLPAMRDREAILSDILPFSNNCTLVLTGHSHHAGLVNCADITVVNPGSVGLPAYDDDTPPHLMSSGSPHARYAILSPTDTGWETEFVSVEYDWERAAQMAETNKRTDWAQWLRSGMA